MTAPLLSAAACAEIAAQGRERTDADALARPVQPGMRRYRIHNEDGSTTTIEARSLWQAIEIAGMLEWPYHAIEGL